MEDKKKELRFLRLTVPEVNKDRRDALNNGVSVYYDESKIQIDRTKATYVPRMEREVNAQPKEEADEARNQFDKTYDDAIKLAEHTIDEKKKEIEAAYQRYLKKKAQQEQQRQEQAAAEGENVKNQMRLPIEE